MKLLRLALAMTTAVTAGSLSCGAESPSVETERAALPAGFAARVGSDLVHVETVARVAHAERLAPGVARERAVSDAIFARGARDSLSRASIETAERAALARALLSVIAEQSAERGPPTDEEIARISAERWSEFERPEAARTTHVVVIANEPEQLGKARELAAKIQSEVQGVADPEQFIARARGVPAEGFEVRAERLPAVTSDGRSLPAAGVSAPSGRFDVDFARAALSLRAAGELSGIVKTQFGYHVILLEERLPAKFVPIEERRQLLAGEVRRRRAEALRRDLVARLSTEIPVERSRSVEELTAMVSVAP